ncbi:MAG: GIY-YIG nuclease family protein, partial [Candidatus Omnitrophica bacterium]|nr:GIY-YIG nuclease family protein [Candidatus Omnitrophota bacterium]
MKSEINSLPEVCGVYTIKSKDKKIIYIGKAINIKKRLQSHFRNLEARSVAMQQEADSVEYISCDTEEQALILEATLIKENKPKYNVELKDGKSYPYLVLTNDDYPKVHIKRIIKSEISDPTLFGPFTNSALLKKALNLTRKIFPFCTCRKPKRSCLYCHLNLCPYPPSLSQAKYRENIKGVCQIFSGQRRKLIERMQRRMNALGKQQKFEQAAALRDRLIAIYSLYAGKRQVNELLLLKDVLKLRKIPFIIEAVDIASLSGKYATGAIVRFKDGIPEKSGYRKYKIKETGKIDDYKMIGEVIKRRLNKKVDLPNLLIIDGGLGHVNTGAKVLDSLRIKIPLIGIAKENEEIYFPNVSKPLILPKSNPALMLIQRVRDEAHRFTHKYHLLLRKGSGLSCFTCET